MLYGMTSVYLSYASTVCDVNHVTICIQGSPAFMSVCALGVKITKTPPPRDGNLYLLPTRLATFLLVIYPMRSA